MSQSLSNLAQRLADAPDFLASALAEFARSEKLDDASLAQHLGCTIETLTLLRLCRMPREQRPFFVPDIETVAARFGIAAEILFDVVRRGQTLMHLRNRGAEHQQGAELSSGGAGRCRGDEPIRRTDVMSVPLWVQELARTFNVSRCRPRQEDSTNSRCWGERARQSLEESARSAPDEIRRGVEVELKRLG